MIHDSNVYVQQETFKVLPNGGSAIEQLAGNTSAEFRQSTKGFFEGTERNLIALIPDATKALDVNCKQNLLKVEVFYL